MNIFIETFGCTSNQSISESISWFLKNNNFTLIDEHNINNLDIYFCNTCTVKYTTEQKILHKIRQFSDCNKFVVVIGCMANIQSEKIKNINPKSIILKYCSTLQIKNVLSFINKYKNINLVSISEVIELNNKLNENYKKNDLNYLQLDKLRINKNIHICIISKGCTFNCSYCIVKKAKGNLVSYSPIEIIDNINRALCEGCNEIWITSQDNGQYGLDFKKNSLYYKYNISKLLKEIQNINMNFKIRLGMMNPNSILPIINDLIPLFKNNKMYKVLHIPIQSASNNVLKNMNRKYNIENVNFIINEFRKSIPNITIITDIIVGFSYETDDDFKQTIDWIQKILPDKINISRYSKREKTLSYNFKNLDSRIITKRNKYLVKISDKIKQKKKELFIGKNINVFISKFTKKGNILGRTEEYIPVLFKNNLNYLKIGTIVNVKITGARPGYLIA